MKRITPYTPLPWQQSKFVDSPRYAHASDAWKRNARMDEKRSLRGPGILSEAPRVAIFNELHDLYFAVEAVNSYRPLRKQNARLLKAIRKAMVSLREGKLSRETIHANLFDAITKCSNGRDISYKSRVQESH